MTRTELLASRRLRKIRISNDTLCGILLGYLRLVFQANVEIVSVIEERDIPTSKFLIYIGSAEYESIAVNVEIPISYEFRIETMALDLELNLKSQEGSE